MHHDMRHALLWAACMLTAPLAAYVSRWLPTGPTSGELEAMAATLAGITAGLSFPVRDVVRTRSGRFGLSLGCGLALGAAPSLYGLSARVAAGCTIDWFMYLLSATTMAIHYPGLRRNQPGA